MSQAIKEEENDTGATNVKSLSRSEGTWKDILAGGISGGLTRMLIAPLDVIKIRFQVQTRPNLSGNGATTSYYYSGLWDSIKTILKQEGFVAFWNGNLLAELLYIGYVGAQFGSYAFFHDSILGFVPAERRESTQARASFLSGGLAALTAISLTYPLDLLRTRFAAQAHPKTYHTIPQAMATILKTDGIKGFYAGWGPTCISLVPSMAIQFALYDWAKRTWFGGHGQDNPIVHAFGGALSGTVSKLAVLPLDVLKKRLQIQGLYGHRKSKTDHLTPHRTFNMSETIKHIYITEGLPGFFRGAVPSALKAGISAALTFTFYEQSKILILRVMQKGKSLREKS
jgi:solute carrier family 25 thiamine pyrophosphate transporter 19